MHGIRGQHPPTSSGPIARATAKWSESLRD
jgi:hypothetical protein